MHVSIVLCHNVNLDYILHEFLYWLQYSISYHPNTLLLVRTGINCMLDP